MQVSINATLRFKSTTCITCGCITSMPEDMYDWRVKDHKTFYCPNGHSMSFTGETEEQRLRKELEATQRRLAFEKAAKESAELAASRAHASAARLKKRVGHGVCPCCKRTFKQLAAHMKTKHPEMVEKATSVSARFTNSEKG